jgi:hypothetical protein
MTPEKITCPSTSKMQEFPVKWLLQDSYFTETIMEQSLTFGDILEAADRLSLEEKETLIEVLQRRLVDQRRDELAKEIKAARKEFQAGKCQPASPEELMKDIL